MTPVQCLNKQLDVWQGAKTSADKSYQHGTISNTQWKSYCNNLTTLIDQYKNAILILQKNGVK